MGIAQQIIDGENPSHAQLGVTMSTVNKQLAQRYGFAVDEGAYVSAVQQGSGAEAAGIQAGDIVIAANGDEVTSADGLIIALRSYDVGEKVTLTVMRGNDKMDIEVTLGSDEALQEQQDNSNDQNGLDGMSEDQLRELLDELLNGQGRH